MRFNSTTRIFYSFRFQGCIGHVTQTTPEESPRPLALRSTAWTGSDCANHCVSGGKCNPIDDVTRKECECLQNVHVNEELICKLHLSKSYIDVTDTIKASSSTTSQSAQMTFSSKGTTVLCSSSQTNVKATITENSAPTRAQAASKHAQDSSGVNAQYVDVAYLHQSSSVPGNTNHSQQFGSVPAPTRSSSLVAVISSSVDIPFHASVGNNGSVMAKKSSSWRILGSFVPVCLGLTAAILSGLMNQ